ncbi:hypothetical protein [Alkalinema sp. FACHB-956]|uniref:hypothetical protein n=1 Tax=Alkalinema sp. FACHB-956 TaxID=2692768 RepID=UPI001681F66D|nr:hypothetical protein [Alkalinema sp. FACHB-956]MBD2328225.1 hypothetical protein [Alkalinema sp. FACHB-956]
MSEDFQPESEVPDYLKFDLDAAADRLHRLTVVGRWLFVIFLWLTLGTWSLWSLRKAIALIQDYFTWSAVRYGLIFNPIAGIGLVLCIAMTLSVLIWQSRNILWGLPPRDREHLKAMTIAIRRKGRRHPLWRWVFGQE